MTAKGAVLSEEQKEKSRQRARAYYEAKKHDPEFKAKKRAADKAWSAANPEKKRAWLEANSEKLLAYRREYLAKPENRAVALARSKALYAANRALIDSLKSKPCMDCGTQYEPCVMQFDHRPGTVKQYNVSRMLTHGEAAIRAEIAKCDVVCSNCHSRRTNSRLTQGE